MYLRKDKNFNKGFTTLEIIVSILIFTMVILLVNSMYTISQRSYTEGSTRAELTQNSRVSLDRITREIRQSIDIITVLPDNEADAISEIFFQDGHDVSQITYLYYYLNGTNLMREHRAYYIEGDKDTYVAWNSVGAIKSTLEDRIIGEYYNNLKFWGSNGLLHISIALLKNQRTLSLDTNTFSRN